MFQKKKACGKILTTGGMNPCIGIAIYNPKKKCGYLIHDPHIIQNNKLEKMLVDIIKDLGDKDLLKIRVAGNSIMSGEEKNNIDEMLSNRPYVLETLSKFFNENQYEINWAENNTGTTLTLNTKTGEFLIEPYDPYNIGKKESNNSDDYDSNGNLIE